MRDRLLAEARGNPLALLELPRAGGFAPPDTSSVPTRVERGFQARLADLPGAARMLLTIASADPTGDPGLLWPAARRLDIDVAAASAAATATGLVEFATRVRFCHPLARSAVYRAARRRVGAGPPIGCWPRSPTRSWTRTGGPGIAPRPAPAPTTTSPPTWSCPPSAPGRAGASVAAAAFLERAAALSLDAAKRIERTLAAAQAKLDAGAADAAAELLTTVENAALDELQRARRRPAAGPDRLRPAQRRQRPDVHAAGRAAARRDRTPSGPATASWTRWR